MDQIVDFSLLQFQRPGSTLLPIAALLFDPSTDKLYVAGRAEFASIADPDDEIVLAATVAQLESVSQYDRGSEMLIMLESTLSNSIRMTDRIPIRVKDIRGTLRTIADIFLG